jgi:thiamine biosynthesis protein ThiS
VAGLIAHLGLDARKVAVEHNLSIVPRSLWPATALVEGDRIEIVHFVGGG